MPPHSPAIANYPSTIAATHIHLQIEQEEAYRLLPRLYAVEYLVPLLFGNSREWNGHLAFCVHPLVYLWNYSPAEYGVGFPNKIPGLETDRARRIAERDDILRDYSLIVPRHDLGTLEFRSACSQPTPEDVADLIAFRLCSMDACRGLAILPDPTMRARFYDSAQDGIVDNTTCLAHVSAVLESARRLGLEERVSRKIERLAAISKDLAVAN